MGRKRIRDKAEIGEEDREEATVVETNEVEDKP
jgi:hypothetical protein